MDTHRGTPGVYITEESAFPSSMVGVATAVPAFIGYSEKTERADGGGSLINLPVQISSLADYQLLFGAGAAPGTTDAVPILWESMALFFGNGGGDCYVVSVGSFADFAADLGMTGLAPQRLYAGLDAIAGQYGPTLLVAPDALAMAEPDYYPFACAMLRQAATQQDRFAILDVPGGRKPADKTADLIDTAIKRFRAGFALAGDARSYGACYFPYLDAIIGGNQRILPASAAMAGIYAATDAEKGVWAAPANTNVAMVEDVTIPVSDAEQAGMNLPADGLAVNAIRMFAGRGVLVWGARTLDGNSAENRHINARRTALYIEQSIRLALQSFAFAANDAVTWASVNATISAFLTNLWSQGGLLGDKPSDAFGVSVGLGSTMTLQDILNNRMLVSVTLQLIYPAEFVVLTFDQRMNA